MIVFCKFLAWTLPAQSMAKPACMKNITVAANIKKKISTPCAKLWTVRVTSVIDSSTADAMHCRATVSFPPEEATQVSYLDDINNNGGLEMQISYW